MKVWASCDLPALVITKIPTETGEVIDWLWNGGTATIKWFWKTEIQKDDHIFRKNLKEYSQQKQAGLTQHFILFMEKQVYISLSCVYLMEKVHVNLCLSLPGIIIYKENI